MLNRPAHYLYVLSIVLVANKESNNQNTELPLNFKDTKVTRS